MKRLTGDLIALAREGRFDVIVHGCNCHNAMGAGIARVIARAFPEAEAADKATTPGDPSKLGIYSSATVDCDGHALTIVNAYTQFGHARGRRNADYDAISAVFQAIAADFPDARIGYPLIGAGLAGGDWAEIAPRIDAALTDCDHTLVTLPEATGAGGPS